MEQRNQLFLQICTHVNEQVAAANQIEPGERRVFGNVMFRKHQHVSNALVHAVTAAIRLQAEKARQPLGRYIHCDAGRVQRGAGSGNGAAVHIAGKHLQLDGRPERRRMLLQQDGDGIGLFAGGAAGHPDADATARRFVRKQFGNDLRGEHLEGIRVAEKIRHANQKITKQRFHLGRRLLQVFHVAVDPLDLVHRHAPFDAAVNGAGLVLRKVVAGLGAHQHENLFQRIFGLRLGGRSAAGLRWLAKRVVGIGHQLGRHLGRCHLVVHQARAKRAARHAVKLARRRDLRHDHATAALDGAHAQRAVAAGA